MLINMRNGLMGGGGLSAKSYVQDGLIAMWDGIENAGWGVHDPNATVWKDLSGNEHDLTAYGSISWYDNAAHFSGASYFRQAEISTAAVLECVFARRVATGFFMLYQNGTKNLLGLNNGIICLSSADSQRNAYSPIIDTVKHSVYCDYLSWAFVKDGVPQEPVSIDGNGASGHYLQLGARFYGNSISGYVNGDIHCVRLYSRALTAAEIAANYAVDKARFNLPDAT